MPNTHTIILIKAILLLTFGLLRPEVKAQNALVDSLINETLDMLRAGKYQEALELSNDLKQMVNSFERIDTVEYIRVLLTEGLSNYFLGNYQEAEEVYLVAEKIQRERFGIENLQYIGITAKLIGLYISQKLNDKAKPLINLSLDLNRKLENQNTVAYAVLLQNKSEIYSFESKYDSAVYTLNQAKEILLNVTGPQNRYYAQIVGAMGEPYSMMEQFETSVSCYVEAASIYEKLYSNQHPLALSMHYNIARVKIISGEYQEAEYILLNLEPSYNAVYGELSPSYAEFINLTGLLYIYLGNFEKAEKYALRTKDLRAAIYGENSTFNIESMVNLLSIYTYRKKYNEAKQLAENAITLYERLESKQVETFITLNFNLGIINTWLRLYTEAEHNIMEVRELVEHTYGKRHERYAEVLHGLGLLYTSMKKYHEAIRALEECKDIRDQTLGPMDLSYTATLYDLAFAYYAVQDTQYLRYYTLASALDQMVIRKVRLFQTQQELESAIAVVNYNISKRRAVLCQTDYWMNDLEYNAELMTKGFLLQDYRYLRTLTKNDITMDSFFNKIVENNELLAIEYTKKQDRVNETIIDSLISDNEIYEKKIHIEAGVSTLEIDDIEWRDIQNNLKPNEAAVEFIRFYLPQESGPEDDSVFYAAMLIRKHTLRPAFISLCTEGDLNFMFSKTNMRRQELVQEQYFSTSDSMKSIFELIWRPVLAQCKDVDLIYFSPVGTLNRINASAVSIDPSTIIADVFDLKMIGSTRQIVTDTLTIDHNNEIALFGNIQYNADTLFALENDTASYESASKPSSLIDFASTDASLRGGEWIQLVGSLKELSNIEEIALREDIPCNLYQNEIASEEAFKKLSISDNRSASPWIIHVTTHGYFFDDPNETTLAPLFNQEPIFKLSDHPMIRSGLILAGGNYAWKHGHPYRPGMEDGILTAYEISQMDLSDTELVVLSACETGLGDIEGNEGVYGLQRAFKIAGVKNLIMSLWQVPDKATAELMTMFYENWLIKEMTIRQALYSAQKTMRDKGYEHFYWAGFVLVE